MKYMAPHSPILEPEKNREGICEQHRTIFSIGALFYSDYVFFQIFIPIVLFFPLVLGLPPVHFMFIVVESVMIVPCCIFVLPSEKPFSSFLSLSVLPLQFLGAFLGLFRCSAAIPSRLHFDFHNPVLS